MWRCTDTKLDAVVALKIVSRDVDLERWRREVAMARRIADRNVCRVHDLGDTEELRYVTMELVEGTSLRTRLSEDLPPTEARDLFRQIVSGVAAIHAAGVVHRDLKPENIVVDKDGRAVIVDFGLARDPSVLNRTVTNDGTVVGTPKYMSPEQAAGEVVDARTDVWALGLVGHEILAGALPKLARAGRAVDPIVETKWPNADVTFVLRRCLSAVAEDRYADAGKVLDALTKPRARWGVRIGVGLAIAAGVGGAFAIAFRERASTPAKPAPVVMPPPGPSTPYRMQQITTTDAAWPGGSPMSIAISPDAKRFAYTTGDGKLYVRELAGGAVITYPLAKADDGRPLLVTSFAAGWYSDGSIAELGSTIRGEWQLLRVYPDGRQELVYRHAQRFTAAVSVGDRVAIAIPDYAMFVLSPGDATPKQVATVGRGETIMGLAWSPDGARVAYQRLSGTGQDAVVQIMSAAGDEIHEVWRGQTSMMVDTLLAWLDGERLAHSVQDPSTRKITLETITIATRETKTHETFEGTYVGIGSGAKGVVVLLRGTATREIQLGDKSADKLVPMHDRSLRAGALAGWTTDGQVVFSAGATDDAMQVMRATPGSAPVPWPNMEVGLEIPDTVVGNDVIVHYVEHGELTIDRVDPIGTHTELFTLRPATVPVVVRCAGDRAAPCVFEEIEANTVRWTELDPIKGTRGRVLHERPVGEHGTRDFAVSPDGSKLAIVEGTSDVTVIDIATATPEKARAVGDGTAMQSLGFAASGELWGTSIGYRGRLFGLMSFTRYPDPTPHFGPPRDRGPFRDAMRLYSRPSPSPDGSKVAILVREFHLDVWRVDGM